MWTHYLLIGDEIGGDGSEEGVPGALSLINCCRQAIAGFKMKFRTCHA